MINDTTMGGCSRTALIQDVVRAIGNFRQATGAITYRC
jgi:hypothetical protein